MQVHRELFIRGEPATLQAVVDDISRSLTDLWERDQEAEEHLRRGATRFAHCFISPTGPRQPRATVILLEMCPSTLYVANIVPSDSHELSRDEYNVILADFFHRYALPAASRHGAKAELTEPEAGLDRCLPEEVADKLRRFSQGANKRTAATHPADRERWYDFLVAAQESAVDFTAATLERWLIEEEEWSEEAAYRLAAEYNFARGLLEFADARKVGV